VVFLSIDIGLGKFYPCNIGLRNNMVPQDETDPCQQGGRNKIRPHQPAKTYPTCKNSHYFRISRHAGGEKDGGNENDHRTEQVSVIHYEIEVIINNDLFGTGSLRYKILDFFRDIEDHCNRQNEGYGQEEG